MGLRIPVSSRRTLLIILAITSLLSLFLFRETISSISPTLPTWSTSPTSSSDPPFPDLIDESPSNTHSALDDLPNGIREFNEPQIARLEAALMEGMEPGERPETQLVMAGLNWALAYTWGATGGETYWLESFMRASMSLGHPFVLVPSAIGSWGPLSLAREYNQKYPGCTKMILVDPGLVRNEIAETRRMKKEGVKGWIPEHLLVGMDYFNDPRVILRAHGQDALNTDWGRIDTPYGPAFRVSPNPHPKETESHYLPYAIDGVKIGQEFIPHSERPHAQMYILGRNTGYLVKPHVWSTTVLEGLEDLTGGKLIIGMDTSESEEGNKALAASNLTNLGRLDRPRFYDLLAHSSVLIGMGGDPAVSPTPYEALYLGVPLINPIVLWDEEDKDNKDEWVTLHDWLKHVGEPYVYNVFSGDVDGLHRAVKKAIANPIESFVLPHMTPAAVKNQVNTFLNLDWKGFMDEYIRKHPGS